MTGSANAIRFGPLPAGSLHLCIDMQNLLVRSDSPWRADWAERVMPAILRLTEHAPAQAIFTRFIPPPSPEDMPGAWQRYYRHWKNLTQDEIDPALLSLIDPLPAFAPPALILDKPVYSAFSGQRLQQVLDQRGVDTLIVSGAETDVCVLATVLGAVDRGYRVILAIDAICSSNDRTHDALVAFYSTRLSQQVELADTETILNTWTPGGQ